jgi:hypothetical protein
MIKFGTNAMSGSSALKVKVRIRVLQKATLGVSLQKLPTAFSQGIDPLARFWANHQKLDH